MRGHTWIPRQARQWPFSSSATFARRLPKWQSMRTPGQKHFNFSGRETRFSFKERKRAFAFHETGEPSSQKIITRDEPRYRPLPMQMIEDLPRGCVTIAADNHSEKGPFPGGRVARNGWDWNFPSHGAHLMGVLSKPKSIKTRVVVGLAWFVNSGIVAHFHVAAPNAFGALRHLGNRPSRYGLVSGREGWRAKRRECCRVCCGLSC